MLANISTIFALCMQKTRSLKVKNLIPKKVKQVTSDLTEHQILILVVYLWIVTMHGLLYYVGIVV